MPEYTPNDYNDTCRNYGSDQMPMQDGACRDCGEFQYPLTRVIEKHCDTLQAPLAYVRMRTNSERMEKLAMDYRSALKDMVDLVKDVIENGNDEEYARIEKAEAILNLEP